MRQPNKIMEKIYHIYTDKNVCIYPCLTEESFGKIWKNITEKKENHYYEYEELEINRNIILNASY